MSADNQQSIVLKLDGDDLRVTGIDGVLTGDVLSILRAAKAALRLVTEVFGADGPVAVTSVRQPAAWPTDGGFVAGRVPCGVPEGEVDDLRWVAWQHWGTPIRLLPSENVLGAIDPYAANPPTLPCRWCSDRAWRRAGDGWTCASCHADPRAPRSSTFEVLYARPGGAELFEIGPWQTCLRCGSRRWWHAGVAGDQCATCHPPVGEASP